MHIDFLPFWGWAELPSGNSDIETPMVSNGNRSTNGYVDSPEATFTYVIFIYLSIYDCYGMFDMSYLTIVLL